MRDEQRDIDEIILRVRQEIPTVSVDQLKVAHPGADDDGLWYFSAPETEDEIQIESPHGMCPFLVEGGPHEPRTARTIGEAVSLIVYFLQASSD